MASKAASADDMPEDGKTAPKAGGKKKLILIGGVVALLAAGGGGFFFYQKSKAAAAQVSVKKVPFFYDMPEMTANLAMQPGQERPIFLRIKVSLELEDQKMVAQITPLLPRVVDNFQVYLRELRPSDLEGSAGIYRLREELVRRVNSAIYPARIETVLFKDVLVQ
jgi:flagellar protein FliL